MTRIFDCFTFSTELDLLEFRLDLLAPVVDQFVIVEAPRTHSGMDKELLFEANRSRFERHSSVITHVIVDDLPLPIPDRWVPEVFQRDAILRGLDGAEPNDLVVVTDVDEVPDPAVLASLRTQEFDALALEMRMCYYRGNWEASPRWSEGRVARRAVIGSPAQLRQSRSLSLIREAGAHLSYLMDTAAIARKYQSFAHQELDTARERSPTYLAAMQALAVLAITGDNLGVTSRSELSEVQRALLKRSPELFSFEDPSAGLRNAARAWRRVRSSSHFPPRLVTLGDSVLAGVVQRAVRRNPQVAHRNVGASIGIKG